MLNLTRRPGETIKIGSDIEVTVLGIKGNQVRIGISAPREVNVAREELLTRPQGTISTTDEKGKPRATGAFSIQATGKLSRYQLTARHAE